MLLNILQRPDGSIDEEADFILSELAAWFAINSEAVYGTRPFHQTSGVLVVDLPDRRDTHLPGVLKIEL